MAATAIQHQHPATLAERPDFHVIGEIVEPGEAGFRQGDHRRGDVETEGVDPLEAEFAGAQGGAAEPGSGAAAGIEQREAAPAGEAGRIPRGRRRSAASRRR